MSTKVLKKREPTSSLPDNFTTKKLRKSKSRDKKRGGQDPSDACLSPIQSCEDGATYLSDTYMSGLFTPYSTFSISSKVTGVSCKSRRRAKEQRKG